MQILEKSLLPLMFWSEFKICSFLSFCIQIQHAYYSA